MSETWERPYTPGTGRWLVIGWEAAALALLGWTTTRQFGLTGHGIHVLAGVIAALWVIGAWRIHHMGAYLGPDPACASTACSAPAPCAGAEVTHVRLHRTTHHLGPWHIESGLTVLIDRRDGATVNTELWAQGVDFHARPTVFRAVYHELRDRHRANSNP